MCECECVCVSVYEYVCVPISVCVCAYVCYTCYFLKVYEIYFTWMAPKAARNAVSLYEGASPWVTGLNLDQ